jgi:hypothetical protein
MVVFTYWNGDIAGIVPFQQAWEAVDAESQVYNDADVFRILSTMNSRYGQIYRRIRIAACKSDVARLALLYEHGGLYMDAHSAPHNVVAFTNLLEEMKKWELIIFDEPRNYQYQGDIHILTGALAGRRGSTILTDLIAGIMNNLENHARREAASEARIDYNIFVISGPWEVRCKLFTLTKPFLVKPELQERVLRMVLDHDLAERAFLWYVNYGYRGAGQHWSERQEVEPLFDA